jgi:hypothetical protein
VRLGAEVGSDLRRAPAWLGAETRRTHAASVLYLAYSSFSEHAQQVPRFSFGDPKRRMQAHPPGPGLPKHDPSVISEAFFMTLNHDAECCFTGGLPGRLCSQSNSGPLGVAGDRQQAAYLAAGRAPGRCGAIGHATWGSDRVTLNM